VRSSSKFESTNVAKRTPQTGMANGKPSPSGNW
jgi:hypothetical protein